MPASAVARRTPAITGMSGTVLGASGETVEDIAGRLDGSWICRWPGDARPLLCFRYPWRQRSDSEFLLLRRGCHLAVGRLGRVSRLGVRFRLRLGGIGRRLVQTLDLGFRAQLGDIVGLGLASDILLDL